MYILSIVAVVLVTLLTVLLSGGSQVLLSLSSFIDFPSILLLIILCVPILISSNLLKDFNNAFRLVMTKNRDTSLTEIKRAIEAVELVIKVLMYGGIFITFCGLLMMLRYLDNMSLLGPNLAVAVLPVIYALAIDLMLLPLKAKLKVMMIEFMK